MRRVMSLFLVFTLLFSGTALAFARGSSLPGENIVVFMQSEDGTYRMSNIDAMPNSAEAVVATPTEDQGTYYVQDNHYLIWAYDDKYVPADCIDINVDDFQENDAIFEEYQVPEEVIESLQEEIMTQKAQGNEKFDVEMFAPRYTDGSWWEGEYTYKTHTLKKYVTSILNASSDFEFKGEEAFEFADEAESLAISIGGIWLKSFSIFGVGQSALELWQALTGKEYVYGGNNDRIEINIWYDKRIEHTCVENEGAGGWSLGCKAEKVDIESAYTTVHFQGESASYDEDINETFYTEHYNDADDMAIKYFVSDGYIDDPVELEIGSYIAVF